MSSTAELVLRAPHVALSVRVCESCKPHDSGVLGTDGQARHFLECLE